MFYSLHFPKIGAGVDGSRGGCGMSGGMRESLQQSGARIQTDQSTTTQSRASQIDQLPNDDEIYVVCSLKNLKIDDDEIIDIDKLKERRHLDQEKIHDIDVDNDFDTRETESQA